MRAGRGPMTGSGVIRHLGDQDGGSRSALRTTDLKLKEARQLRRPYYLRRFRRRRPQASLISKATISTMVAATMGPAIIANVVSILQPREHNARQRAERRFVPRPVQKFKLGHRGAEPAGRADRSPP
jgi:hypothetical protein